MELLLISCLEWQQCLWRTKGDDEKLGSTIMGYFCYTCELHKCIKRKVIERLNFIPSVSLTSVHSIHLRNSILRSWTVFETCFSVTVMNLGSFFISVKILNLNHHGCCSRIALWWWHSTYVNVRWKGKLYKNEEGH